MLTKIIALCSTCVVRSSPAVSPFVGWQPSNAMRQVPRMFAGNESVVMFTGSNSSEYSSCTKWWPKAREMVRLTYAKALFATSFFVRCGDTVTKGKIEAGSALDQATATWQQHFIQGPLDSRAYLVYEWDGVELNTTYLMSKVQKEGWAGAALLTTNESANVCLQLNSETQEYDTLVVIDLSSHTSQSNGKCSPIYSASPVSSMDGLLVQDLWKPPTLRVAVSSIAAIFAESKVYRMLMIVDISSLSTEDFQLYTMFASWFAGTSNYPWLTLAPPANSSVVADWTQEVQVWRSTLRERWGLSQREDAHSLTQSHWIVAPQILIHDRFLTTDQGTVCTVDRFLDDLQERYGGVDAVLLWGNYPNIGIDDRSQFDFAEDIIDVLEACIQQFQSYNVDVILPLLPWDHGTARSHSTNVANVVQLAERLGVQAINGDTMYGMRNAVDRFPSNFILMPECGTDLRESIELMYSETNDPYRADAGLRNALPFDAVSWNYISILEPGNYATGRAIADADTYGNITTGYLNTSEVIVPGYLHGPPLVSRAKLLDTSHNALQCDRWATDHKNLLHHAFFSGSGYVSWENVWSIWNGLSEYDQQAIKRISHLFRALTTIIFDPDTLYQPFVMTDDLPPGCYASLFISNSSSRALWLLLNRRGTDEDSNRTNANSRLPDDTLSISLPAACIAAECCVDIYNGRRLSENQTQLPFEPYGYAALYASTEADCPTDEFLATRSNLTATPLYSYSTQPHVLTQVRVLDGVTTSTTYDSTNMTFIPGGPYTFITKGIQMEGYGGLSGPSSDFGQPDVQFEWESKPNRWHNATLNMDPFYIDTYLVTNRRYLQFLNDSGYTPIDSKNFLKHMANVTEDIDEEPVRWISLADARSYCNFYNKTLPRSFQWQRVAQGPSGDRLFPWGDDWDARAVPVPDSGFSMSSPPRVGAHPLGSSVEGVHDLVATIWQLSDEFCDDHTCRVIIRGGSYYRPTFSSWYLPSAYRNDEQQTYLLFSDALDRSGGIGFRCVANAAV